MREFSAGKLSKEREENADADSFDSRSVKQPEKEVKVFEQNCLLKDPSGFLSII